MRDPYGNDKSLYLDHVNINNLVVTLYYHFKNILGVKPG